jgi:hypothetical protein
VVFRPALGAGMVEGAVQGRGGLQALLISSINSRNFSFIWATSLR